MNKTVRIVAGIAGGLLLLILISDLLSYYNAIILYFTPIGIIFLLISIILLIIGYLIKKTYQYTFGETKSNKIPRHYDSERDNPHSRYE